MKSANMLKRIALQHLNSSGKMLAIGHLSKYESIHTNPVLYLQLFPWLFPYGLGLVPSPKMDILDSV